MRTALGSRRARKLDRSADDDQAPLTDEPQPAVADRPLQSQWTGGSALAAKAATGLLWSALLCGPAALVLAGGSLLNGAAPVAAAPPPVIDRTGEQAAVAEFAGRLVRLWLTSVRGQEQPLQELVPGAELTLPEVAWTAGPTTTADIRRQQDGTWLVVSAVTVGPLEATRTAAAGDGTLPPPLPVRFYAVPVRVDDAGLVALTLPAPVPAPTNAASAPRLGYRHQVPSTDPLVTSVGQFLTALLAGSGELSRYVSPGVDVTPITPAPYTEVTVTDVTADRELVTGAAPPAEDTQLRALATATAVADGKRRAVVQYPLTLTVRGGRWEVTAIDPAPALHQSTSSPDAATNPSPPASTSGPLPTVPPSLGTPTPVTPTPVTPN